MRLSQAMRHDMSFLLTILKYGIQLKVLKCEKFDIFMIALVKIVVTKVAKEYQERSRETGCLGASSSKKIRAVVLLFQNEQVIEYVFVPSLSNIVLHCPTIQTLAHLRRVNFRICQTQSNIKPSYTIEI